MTYMDRRMRLKKIVLNVFILCGLFVVTIATTPSILVAVTDETFDAKWYSW